MQIDPEHIEVEKNAEPRFGVRPIGKLVGLIIFVGVFLRFYFYFVFDRSLWIDEAALALNIIDRGYFQFFGPLDYLQKAPIGFLALVKLSSELIGFTEKVLRLVPFLFGTGALILFAAVARRYLSGISVPVAIGLVAVSPRLIHYSGELKEYSSDLFWAALILYLGIDLLRRPRSNLLPIALVGTIAVWVSFPSVFSLASIGTLLAYRSIVDKNWKEFSKLVVMGGVWIVSFVPHFLFTAKHLYEPSWGKASGGKWFVPLVPNSLQDLEWFARYPLRLFENPVGVFIGLGAVLFVLGFSLAISRKKPETWLLLGPFVFVFLASGLRLYPFPGRFLHFVVPALILLIASGLGLFWDLLGKTPAIVRTSARVVALVLLFLFPVGQTFQLMTVTLQAENHLYREESRPVLEEILREGQMGDIVYVYWGAWPAFRYYDHLYDELVKFQQVRGINNPPDWREYEDDLRKLAGNRRVWVLFSHTWVGNGKETCLLLLDRMGRRVRSFSAQGAEAHLYDLSARRED